MRLNINMLNVCDNSDTILDKTLTLENVARLAVPSKKKNLIIQQFEKLAACVFIVVHTTDGNYKLMYITAIIAFLPRDHAKWHAQQTFMQETVELSLTSG